ncbi:MAG: hypothetical protein PUC88_02555 [Clostridia bacterium]|nr:hypothetical protein [Clostridia bacterium]
MKTNKKVKNKQIITLLIIALFLLSSIFAEILLSNSLIIKLSDDKYSVTDIDLNDTQSIAIDTENNIMTIYDIDIEAASVDIEFSGVSKYADIDLSFTDDNFKNSSKYAGTYHFYSQNDGKAETFRINPYGKLHTLSIRLNNSSKNFNIESITFNKAPDFSFNFLRMFILFATATIVFLIIKYKAWNIIYDNKKALHRVLLVLVALSCMLTPMFIKANTQAKGVNNGHYDYPLEGDLSDYGLYTLQFDAFLKGQLHLDVEINNDVIEEMENPYDHSQRSNVPHGVIWDSAYYNGKTYSYFGVAPIIYVTYPYYILTGNVPDEFTISATLAFFASMFISLAFMELIKYFCKKPSLLLMMAGILAVNFSSLIYLSQSMANMYNIACLSGMLFLSALLYTSFRAVRTENIILRNVIFALSGLACISLLASRPIVILYALIIVPIYISFLTNKKFSIKNKISAVACFFAPIIIFGVALMWYNMARFDSPFQFGAIYNFTVSDTSNNSIRLYMLPVAIYHMFLQSAKVDSVFPFVHSQYTVLGTYRTYTYVASTIGSIFYPATWGLFASMPVTKGKENREKRFVIGAVIAMLFAIAFLDTCIAGVHLRYSTDIMLIASLFGTVLTILVAEKLKDLGENVFKPFFAGFMIMFILSALFGSALIFSNARNLIMNNHPGMYDFIASIFRF